MLTICDVLIEVNKERGHENTLKNLLILDKNTLRKTDLRQYCQFTLSNIIDYFDKL